jgi:hypothetical protein
MGSNEAFRMNKYILNIETLKKNLHLQVMARLRPSKLNIPKNWVPFSQIDKLVARNFIMDMPFKKVLEIFPNFTVDFINRCKDYALTNNWKLPNNWKYVSKHK